MLRGTLVENVKKVEIQPTLLYTVEKVCTPNAGSNFKTVSKSEQKIGPTLMLICFKQVDLLCSVVVQEPEPHLITFPSRSALK
jgi:hypothetical protein